MKRCPTCNQTFSDQSLAFCIDDGTPLVTAESADETHLDEATVVQSSSTRDESSSAGRSGPANPANDDAPAYQPPGSYLPPGQNKRRAWPWVLGILAIVFIVVAGLGIAAALLIPNILRASSNKNLNTNTGVERRGNSNVNLNSNADSSATDENENSDGNSEADDSTPPPTDHEAVLAELKNLEDEWTVANINADKKKLNLILADDYVGITEGRVQGKAEYLKTIERDTAIQHWEFEDLKVSLNGDRASLTGILRLDVKDQKGKDQKLAYQFTDKFVWRDGRWQATASEVNPLPAKPGTAV